MNELIEDTKKKFDSGKLALLAVAFLASILASFYLGWVGSVLWTWFVLPSFGIVSPGFVALAGIALLAKLMTYHVSLSDFKLLIDQRTPDAAKVRWLGILVSFLVSTSFLLGGWLLHWFM